MFSEKGLHEGLLSYKRQHRKKPKVVARLSGTRVYSLFIVPLSVGAVDRLVSSYSRSITKDILILVIFPEDRARELTKGQILMYQRKEF